ncbi:MAG: hypothetical protein ACLQB4_04315, partial [Beijerinckiaceae bacterium]
RGFAVAPHGLSVPPLRQQRRVGRRQQVELDPLIVNRNGAIEIRNGARAPAGRLENRSPHAKAALCAA